MTVKRLLLVAIAILPLTAQAEPRRMSKLVEFDYCKVHVHSKQREQLAEVARELKANPTAKVTVEGHAFALNEEDSIALGQRRADMVRDLLVRYGVDPANITAIDNSRSGEAGRYVDLVIDAR